MSVPGAARACALLAVIASLLAACGSDEKTAASTTTAAVAATTTTVNGTGSTTVPTTTTTSEPVHTIEVVYANGQVVGGVRTETVKLGEKVRLRVTSDVAEEVHVHTYDVMADVAAGGTAELELAAIIPGRHEVELEKKGRQLLILEVR